MTYSGGKPFVEHISLQQAGFTILYRHRHKLRALTSLFSPLPSTLNRLLLFERFKVLGGLVSVALSLEFPLVAVSNCPSLCCPDFPLPID